MQHFPHLPGATPITPTAQISVTQQGGRAKCLQRLIRMGLPVPRTLALGFRTVAGLAQGGQIDTESLLSAFPDRPLVSVRPSSARPDWGGPATVLNVGMCRATHADLVPKIGAQAADVLYTRFIRAYAVQIKNISPDIFSTSKGYEEKLGAYKAATGSDFPQDPADQLSEILQAMAQAWQSPTARILRQAKGAPEDAGLGLVIQEMVLGVGDTERGEYGSGVIQFVSPDDGKPQITGRYLSQSQGRDALLEGAGALYLTRDPRGPALEDLSPDIYAALQDHGALCRARLHEEMQVEFTIQAGNLHILDALRTPRSPRAALRIAVDLATDGIIPEAEAVMRVPPRTLLDVLHRQVSPEARADVICKGIAASPGAATGCLVFTAEDAQACAARGEACILLRRETLPSDVLGMHSAAGIVTERGGATSHAAVIARGLGLPAIVGVSDLQVTESKAITPGGIVLSQGDIVTLDGTSGQLLAGAVALTDPVTDDSYQVLLAWADEHRDLGVRANCDTPADAQVAAQFGAEGIGLCRTEHMFLDGPSLTAMREMIFAERPADRADALKQLLPVQRADFAELFRIMSGQPVCIRLLDPPLHEFLPTDPIGQSQLAAVLDLPREQIEARVKVLAEVNPMLGMRGVRLGIAVPEIYAMQARAIFEAAIANPTPVIPEIMIPLVSARREVDLIRAQMDAVAEDVRRETGAELNYVLGVMVETPRAALRADEIAASSRFLSFGTNDLTQMTYGLSRDDAARFMAAYVSQGVFPEDPFLRLDTDGVGELLRIGAERGRAIRPDITLSICGEHGGDPDSIAFCRAAGFDYVSCSPFRVPVARLAAAQLAIREIGVGAMAPPER